MSLMSRHPETRHAQVIAYNKSEVDRIKELAVEFKSREEDGLVLLAAAALAFFALTRDTSVKYEVEPNSIEEVVTSIVTNTFHDMICLGCSGDA